MQRQDGENGQMKARRAEDKRKRGTLGAIQLHTQLANQQITSAIARTAGQGRAQNRRERLDHSCLSPMLVRMKPSRWRSPFANQTLSISAATVASLYSVTKSGGTGVSKCFVPDSV